jgi:hypothetical protein
MNNSLDFLLAAMPGGGHADPMLSVARGLLDRGHRVRVMADPTLESAVEAAGAVWVPWRRGPLKDGSVDPACGSYTGTVISSPAQEMADIRDRLPCGPAADFAADTRDELRRRPADVVATDHMLPGVRSARRRRGPPPPRSR